MRKRGRYEKVKPKKRGGRVLLIILCCIVLLLAGVGVAGVMLYKDMVGKIDYVTVESQDYTMSPEILAMMGTEPSTEETEPVVTTEAPTEETVAETTEPPAMKSEDIVNILLVGQSYREGETSRLADTLMLVSINKYTKQITLTSFLRDTYVDLPDYMGHTCGWNRINTNYALGYVWGGPGGAMEMTNLCIKNNFGIEVDYNIEIGFEAFEEAINLMGGVTLELTEAEADYINGLGRDYLMTMEPGENLMWGCEALEYARMRKAEGDNDSDIKRTERQRKLITALFSKLINMNMSRIKNMVDQILPMIKTNMPEEKITEYLVELVPVLLQMNIEHGGTCPAQGTYWAEDKETPDGWASVLCFNSNDQKKIFMPITEGYAP